MAVALDISWMLDWIGIRASETGKDNFQSALRVTCIGYLRDTCAAALFVSHFAQRVANTLRNPSIVLPFQSSPEDMDICYRAADITLVACEVDTFGRAAEESLACETPVISSDAGGLSEVAPHRIVGWVVPNRDGSGFEYALRRPLEVETLRSCLAEGGLELVRARFADHHITEQYLNLYEEIRLERSQS
jgi:glycosyltransferase involved in cell wall biosynthesis